MTRLTIEATREDHRLAKLAAIAIGLSIVDAAIPSPLPGIKPGFANIVTLLVLYSYGWRNTAWVTGLRVMTGSLVTGTFLSPSFALSFSGATFSLLVLLAATKLPSDRFGPVGFSILGAFGHMAGQLLVVDLRLIPHTGLIYLMPMLFGAALIFGTINGLIVVRLLKINTLPVETTNNAATGRLA